MGKHMLFLTFYLILPLNFTNLLANNAGIHNNITEFLNIQQTKINGIITDTNGIPIAGVNIQIKNTNKGSISDFDGSYTITAKSTDVLVFSALGYVTQTIPVHNQSKINVQLQEDITLLDEVTLNAGYYSVKEKESTGNISKVKQADIERQPLSNPLAALQGRVSGVEITQTSGVPGSGFNIKIRGQNSIRSTGNAPLYIIDGVPFSSTTLGNIQVSGTIIPGVGVSPLNSIHPSDISSIDILKDADATAIYGSRGANGVVLITTKKGKAGKTKFRLNVSSGLGTLTGTIALLNTSEHLKLRKEAYKNDGVTVIPSNAYDINGTWDASKQTDWQKQLLGKTALFTNLQGSISGGNAQTNFLISGNHQKQTTVFPGGFYNSNTSFLTNLNHRSKNEKLHLQLSVNYAASTNNLVSSDLIREVYRLTPNAPDLYNDDGTLNWENATWNNPLRQLEGKYLSNTNNLIGNLRISYNLTKSLKFTTSLGYTQTHQNEKKTTPSTIFNPAYGRGSAFSSIRHNNTSRTSWIVEPQLQWSSNFKNTEVKTLVGMTFQEDKSNQLVQYARGFTSNSLIENIAAANTVIILNNALNSYKYHALFARVHMSHKGKYLLNLTGRRDGSSRFGPNKRFANFGAIGAAWIFSKEKFIETALPFLSFGKLRGSYGTTGNDQIGDYGYLNTYTISSSKYQNINGLEPSRLFNPDFSWEVNKKLEIALELGLFNDRIFMSSSYYTNTSSNQLVGIPLPGTTGFSTLNANLNATVENKGWEIEFRTINFDTNDFKWSTAFNITVPKNSLLAFPDLEGSTYANRLVIGEPLNIKKLYQLEGVDPQTGLYTFKDYNGDGIISSPNDNRVVRHLNPEFFGGFSNSMSYKGFEFSFLFQFKKQLGKSYVVTGLPGSLTSLPKSYLDRWQKPGDITQIQRLTTGRHPAALKAYVNYLNSTASISDASFIRLKTISLSYQLDKRWLKGLDCKIYLQGQNLLTITGYDGLDPETQSSRTIPPLKIFTLGTTLTF